MKLNNGQQRMIEGNARACDDAVALFDALPCLLRGYCRNTDLVQTGHTRYFKKDEVVTVYVGQKANIISQKASNYCIKFQDSKEKSILLVLRR